MTSNRIQLAAYFQDLYHYAGSACGLEETFWGELHTPYSGNGESPAKVRSMVTKAVQLAKTCRVPLPKLPRRNAAEIKAFAKALYCATALKAFAIRIDPNTGMTFESSEADKFNDLPRWREWIEAKTAYCARHAHPSTLKAMVAYCYLLFADGNDHQIPVHNACEAALEEMAKRPPVGT